MMSSSNGSSQGSCHIPAIPGPALVRTQVAPALPAGGRMGSNAAQTMRMTGGRGGGGCLTELGLPPALITTNINI